MKLAASTASCDVPVTTRAPNREDMAFGDDETDTGEEELSAEEIQESSR